MNIVHQILLFN